MYPLSQRNERQTFKLVLTCNASRGYALPVGADSFWFDLDDLLVDCAPLLGALRLFDPPPPPPPVDVAP